MRALNIVMALLTRREARLIVWYHIIRLRVSPAYLAGIAAGIAIGWGAFLIFAWHAAPVTHDIYVAAIGSTIPAPGRIVPLVDNGMTVEMKWLVKGAILPSRAGTAETARYNFNLPVSNEGPGTTCLTNSDARSGRFLTSGGGGATFPPIMATLGSTIVCVKGYLAP